MLKVIDRKSEMLKLAQGDWVSPSWVENKLEESQWVTQAFVFGKSTARNVGAVIVPSPAFMELMEGRVAGIRQQEEKEANSADTADPSSSTSSAEQLRKLMLRKLSLFCRHNCLRACETPAVVHLEMGGPTTWSRLGLVTGNMKKARRRLHTHYAAEIDTITSTLEAGYAEAAAATTWSSLGGERTDGNAKAAGHECSEKLLGMLEHVVAAGGR